MMESPCSGWITEGVQYTEECKLESLFMRMCHGECILKVYTEGIRESAYWCYSKVQWILELGYSQPGSMGPGTMLRTTRVNVFMSYGTVD